MSTPIQAMPSPNRAIGVKASLLVALLIAPRVSAQTNPVAEPPPSFGEISNQPAAPATSSPPASTPPSAQGSVAPASSPPATAVAAPPPIATTAPAAPTAPTAPTSSEPHRAWVRDGFYLRLVSGMGWMTFRGDGPSGSASVSGLSSNSVIAIGGSIAPGLVLAGTLQATQVSARFKGGPLESVTVTSDDGETFPITRKATAAFSQLGALLDWYPSSTSGAHLAIGAGLGMISVVNQADESTYYGTSGAGTLLVGYDWPIAPTWALGLALVATGSTASTMKHAKTSNETGYRLMPLSVGITTSVLYF